MRATYAKIHLNNFRSNLNVIRSKINKESKFCVAVKADAYGHGALECSKVAEECGVDFLAVACADEGIQLREGGIKLPILVLSLVCPEEMELLIEHRLTPLVFDEEYISCLAAKCRKMNVRDFPVHLAVDTGMGRIGCRAEDAGTVAKFIEKTGVLFFEGMCTHFSVADSLKKEDEEYTQRQFENFNAAVAAVKNAGVNPGIRHAANSALTLSDSGTHLDMCRCGIIAYGYYPGDFTKEYFEKKGSPVELKPVMEMVSKVAAIREFDKDRCVSYGNLWKTAEKTRIAVVPAGYADGILRNFNRDGKGLYVSIGGKPYPVRGRICMDQMMVEIGSDESVKRWDDVVIFGPEESGAFFSAQEIADMTGTISYEITCGVSKSRVPKVFFDE